MDQTNTKRRQTLLKLRKLFRRNGYLRVPNTVGRQVDRQQYKKGYEVRFVALTESELGDIQSLLRRAGVKMGRPFSKHNQIVQPVYGKKVVAGLCEMLRIKMDS